MQYTRPRFPASMGTIHLTLVFTIFAATASAGTVLIDYSGSITSSKADDATFANSGSWMAAGFTVSDGQDSMLTDAKAYGITNFGPSFGIVQDVTGVSGPTWAAFPERCWQR